MAQDRGHTILVTGAGGGSGMYAIKALKRSTAHTVVACDVSPHSAGLYLADRHALVPAARDPQFIPAVRRLIAEHGIDIVLPNVDEELLVFARNRTALGATVVVSDPDTIECCNDKLLTMERLSAVCPCPRGGERFPCVLKPRISRGSKGVYVAGDSGEFALSMQLLERQGYTRADVLVQEYLPGVEYTVDALCDGAGRLVVAVPRERLKTRGGISEAGRTVRHQGIIDSVAAITAALPFFGPINVQFREDSAGCPRLMEINPRCSGGLPIACAAGADIVNLAVQVVNGAALPDVEWRELTVYRYLEELVV